MAGLISHLVQRVFSPEAGLRPQPQNPFEAPEIEPAADVSSMFEDDSRRPALAEQARTRLARRAPGPSPESELEESAVELSITQPSAAETAGQPTAAERLERGRFERTPAVSEPSVTPAAVTARRDRQLERRAPRQRWRSLEARVEQMHAVLRSGSPARPPVAAQLPRLSSDGESPARQRADLEDPSRAPQSAPPPPAAERAAVQADPRERPQLAPLKAATAIARAHQPEPRGRVSARPAVPTPPTVAAPRRDFSDRAAPALEPTVEISIGRVEIRAHSAPQRSAKPAAAKPRLDLGSYLEQRAGSKR